MHDIESIHHIHYVNEHRSIKVDTVETMLSAFLRERIEHPHVCGGNAMCSSCRVVVEEGIINCASRNEKEVIVAKKLGFGPEVRLACQTI